VGVEHVLHVLTSIRPTELEEGLLILPFHQAMRLIKYIDEWIKQGKSIELVANCLFFLLKIHSAQLSTDRTMLQTLLSLRENTRRNLQNLKNIIGFNKAAMTWMKNSIEEATNTDFFDAATKTFFHSTMSTFEFIDTVNGADEL
jgi:U3 small nucleolar RNA-associated protein 12